MANHTRPIAVESKPAPEPPEILTCGIARVGDVYHVIAIRSRGDRIMKREVVASDAHRPYIEDAYRQYSTLNVLDREMNP